MNEQFEAEQFRAADRVFLYGFARILPGALWIGGILFFLLLHSLLNFKNVPPFLTLSCLFAILVVPLWLDRSKLLDPVEYINFGEYVMVKRMMSKRSLPADRVKQIEFSAPPGEEYDDYDTHERKIDVRIRFRRAWTARILATASDAERIVKWGRTYGIPLIHDEVRTRIETSDDP